MPQFNKDQIELVEFGVCRDVENAQRCVLVPIDDSVKNALKEMLNATIASLAAPEDDNAMAQYEPSQKYAPTESLRLPLASDLCAGPRGLFEAQNIPTDAAATGDPSIIEYYFAVFHDRDGRKLIGVRRATQFKGV